MTTSSPGTILEISVFDFSTATSEMLRLQSTGRRNGLLPGLLSLEMTRCVESLSFCIPVVLRLELVPAALCDIVRRPQWLQVGIMHCG